jgi:hypothetical protein
MKDSKYLKDDVGGDDEKDNAEGDADKELFKKRTHKNGGFKSGADHKSGKSFARKRQRVR